MSWLKKLMGLEAIEQIQAEQDALWEEMRRVNTEFVLEVAEQNGIQMARCSVCNGLYVVAKGPCCACSR